MIDNLKSKITGEVKAKYHSELMQNAFPEGIINSAKGLKSVNYNGESSILFFIDKDRNFQCVVQAENSPSGWISHSISKETTAFDVHRNNELGTLKVSYALENNGNTELWISNDLSLTNIDPKKIDRQLAWTNIKLKDSQGETDHISMNQSGLLYSRSYKSDDATYGYLIYGENPIEWPIKKEQSTNNDKTDTGLFTLPENSAEIIQLEAGQLSKQFGAFILYKMNGENTLLFQSFPTKKSDQVLQYRFSPDKTMNAFYTVQGRKGNNELYISGNGIYKYVNAYKEKEIICGNTSEVEFAKIEVSTHGSETTIWALGENNSSTNLYYLTNKFQESLDNTIKKWTSPLPMLYEVDEFSSVKGDTFTNQLFVLGNEENENSLIHIYQDRHTNRWVDEPVVIDSLEKIKFKETFTVNVSFTPQVMTDIIYGEEMALHSSENLLIYIDGCKVAIGPEKVHTLKLQDNMITVVYPTKSISAPELFVNADFLEKQIIIDPAHKLKKTLRDTMTSVTAMRAAKSSDGKPLIDPSVSDKDLKEVVKATKSAYEHMDKMNQKSNETDDSMVTSLGISFSDITDIGNSAWDAMNAAKNKVMDGIDFVVEHVSDGVKFVIKIAGEVMEFVAKIASDVFHFLERLWDKIKLTFKKLMDFLGSLFAWKDILHTKNVMKTYVTNIILGLGDQLGSLQTKMHGYLQEVIDNLEDSKQNMLLDELDKKNAKGFISDTKAKKSDVDPRSNWVSSKKSHLQKGDPQQQAASVISSESMGEITSLMDKLMVHLKALVDDFKVKFSDLFDQFKKVFNGELSIGTFLKYLATTIAQLGLKTAQTIIDLLFELLIEVVKSAAKILNAPIQIPFFSSLYKMLSGSDLSINDLICLLVAVPTTVLYKIGEGEAPFKKESDRKEFENSGKVLFQIN